MVYRKAFDCEVKVTGINKETGMKRFTAVISTDGLDRDYEVLIPKGCRLENYLRNPVLVDAHNYCLPSVGKATALKVGEHGIEMEFEFAPTDRGKMYETLYEGGYQRSFSVGFMGAGSGSYIEVNDTKDTKLTVDVGDGETVELDLTTYPAKPRGIWAKWELLEVSPVVVPSNPEALLIEGRGFVDSVRSAYKAVNGDARVGMLLDELERCLTDMEKSAEFKGAIPTHSTPIDDAQNWNGAAARVELAKWASSDGSGDKETIDWSKYGQGFAWFDETKPDNYTSYKLPHHIPVDGQLVAVWRGVTTAMAVLLGARGGIDLPDADRQGVYNHLAKHYEDAGQTPPPLKDYSEEELKELFPEFYGLKVDDNPEPNVTGEADAGVGGGEELKGVLKELSESLQRGLSELSERLETDSVKLGIMLGYLTEIAEQLNSLKTGSGQGSEDMPDGESPKLSPEEEALKDIWETLKGLTTN